MTGYSVNPKLRTDLAELQTLKDKMAARGNLYGWAAVTGVGAAYAGLLTGALAVSTFTRPAFEKSALEFYTLHFKANGANEAAHAVTEAQAKAADQYVPDSVHACKAAQPAGRDFSACVQARLDHLNGRNPAADLLAPDVLFTAFVTAAAALACHKKLRAMKETRPQFLADRLRHDVLKSDLSDALGLRL